MNFAGKNAVCVGGLGGIGYETVKTLLTKNFAYLFIVDAIENPDAVQALQAINPKTKVVYIKFDITKKTDIKRAISEIVNTVKYIDVLYNGAGIANDRQVELTININLIGLINTTLEALPYMNKNQQGRGGMVVNVASVLGLEPFAALAIYCATKFGVIGFTRALADKFYYDLTGVSFMAICPAFTVTALTAVFDGKDTFEYAKPVTDLLKIAKTQTAEECAELLVKAMEANKNGAIYIIDQGKMEEATPKKYWEPEFTS